MVAETQELESSYFDKCLYSLLKSIGLSVHFSLGDDIVYSTSVDYIFGKCLECDLHAKNSHCSKTM